MKRILCLIARGCTYLNFTLKHFFNQASNKDVQRIKTLLFLKGFKSVHIMYIHLGY